MADGANQVRRRREAPERIEYRQALDRILNFVDREYGNGRAPQQRPDDSAWRKQRAKTIRTLNELREKLDTVCVGANYGKAVGNGAEIMGAVGAIAGGIMSLRGLPIAQAVMNVSNLVHHAGTLIDGVSNVTESLVSAKYLSDIEGILEEDKELSLPLVEWLNFSRDLDANVEEIFGVSLASAKLDFVIKTFYEFSKLSGSVQGFNATMNLMEQGKYSVYIGNGVILEKLQKFSQLLSVSPQLGDRIRVAFSVLSVSTGSLLVFRDGVRAYRSIMGVPNSVVPTLRGGLNPEIPNVGAVSAYCIFQAINLAISVISLINAASIIRQGKSQYSDAMKDLTRALAWELTRMEQL